MTSLGYYEPDVQSILDFEVCYEVSTCRLSWFVRCPNSKKQKTVQDIVCAQICGRVLLCQNKVMGRHPSLLCCQQLQSAEASVTVNNALYSYVEVSHPHMQSLHSQSCIHSQSLLCTHMKTCIFIQLANISPIYTNPLFLIRTQISQTFIVANPD